MGSSRTSRNDKSRYLKSFVIGLVFGLIAGWRTYSLGSPEAMSEPVKLATESLVAWIKAAAAMVGLPAWADGPINFVFGPALPFTAGVFVICAVTEALRAKKLFGRPPIDHIWPNPPDFLDPKLEREGIARYRPLAAGAPFLERKDELARLQRFAGDDDGPPAKFIFITGREGVGKTRLALECLKSLNTFGWDVGVLDPWTKPLDIRHASFRRKTALLIDDPGSIENFWSLLDEFAQKKSKIRVLLASQIRPVDPIDVDARKRIANSEVPVLRISGLSYAALNELAPDLPERARIDARGCPLWVLLKAEDLVELERRVGLREHTVEKGHLSRVLALSALAGPIPRSALRKTLGIYISTTHLKPLFEDVDPRTLEVTLPTFRPDVFADEIVLRDAASYSDDDNADFFVAAVKLNAAAVEYRLASLWRRGARKDERQATARDLLQRVFDEHAPQRVEVLRARARQLVNETSKELRRAKNREYELGSLTHALDELADLADTRPFDRDIRLCEAEGGVGAILRYGEARDFAALERWGARLIALAEDPQFRDDHDIRLQEAKGAFNAIHRYGEARDFAALERWGARLIALAEHPAFRNDHDIRLQEAWCAVNAIHRYGEARDFAALERWGARLIALAEHPAFRDDHDIRLREAEGAINAIHRYGAAGDFAALERWGARLIALAEDPEFRDDHDIRLCEAEGANNAINLCGEARDFAALERWGARLIALAEDPEFRDERDIRLREACGAVNAINRYGAARDFLALEFWGVRLIALAQNPAFRDDLDIRRQQAMGAVNATNWYGAAREFAALERWGAHLIALAEDPAFRHDHDIRLQEAKGAFNAINWYGDARDFAALERWGARLITLAEDPEFRDDNDIRLEEAKGAVNSSYRYGEARDFIASELWGARLIALAEHPAFRDDHDIRRQEAMGAVNAIRCYGNAGASFESKRHAWWLRLANVARAFPGSKGIQNLANRCDLTFAAQGAKGWPYGAPQPSNSTKNLKLRG
jgi:hypothetical protein